MMQCSKKENRIVPFYFVVFFIPVICMIIHMVIRDCYPFGNYTILLGDANTQYLSFFKELHDRLSSGKSLLFSWNSGMGYDFYINLCYYLGSPFSWLALLFGKNHMELGMIFGMLIQLGGCGVTAFYYLLHTNKNQLEKGKIRTIVCMVFATAYAMCNYILAYQYNLMWLISLMLMPLVLLGVEQLVESGNIYLYFGTLTLCLLTNFYFAWFVCLMSVLWFVDQKKGTIKNGINRGIRYAISSITAALCAAVVLVPCYLFVLNRKDPYTMSVDFGSVGNIGNFFQGMFWAGSIDSSGSTMFTNNNYFGIFVLVFVWFYFFRPDIGILQKIKRATEIVILSVSLNWAATIFLLHGFSFPHMFSERFAIILILLLIITGFEGIQILREIRYRYMAGAFAGLLAIICLCFIAGNDLREFYCYMGSIMIICYLFICLILYKRNSIKLESLYLNIIILGFAELISNFFFVNVKNYDIFREREIYAEQWKDDYEHMDKAAGERNTAWMFDRNCFTYSDTNIFSSAINSDMVSCFKKLGLTIQMNGGSYVFRGTTPLTDILFNVKNILTNQPAYYGGYRLAEEMYLNTEQSTETYGIFSTDNLVGFGFVLPESVADWDMDQNPFEVQNEFTNEILGKGNIFSKVELEVLEYPVINCILMSHTDTSITYYNTNFDPDSLAGTGMVFDVPYDMHLYAYAHDDNGTVVRFSIDDEEMLNQTGVYSSPGTMVNLGDLKKGQRVLFSVYNTSEILETGTVYIDFYEYHDDVLQDCIEEMKKSIYVIETFEDTRISGTVNVAEKGILHMSIPYYKGFTAYVDGKKTEIIKTGDAMVGIYMEPGHHEVEFRYLTYGFKTGAILSFIGLIWVSGYVFYIRKSNGRFKR